MTPATAKAVTIVWFGCDLRVDDNPALSDAAARGVVVPVYVYAPEEEAPWAPGAASRWWLDGSLRSLGAELSRRGSALVLRRGPSLAALEALAAECGATRVVWNRRYDPAAANRDATVEASLRARGIETRTFSASLLVEPAEACKRDGTPYRVFTPFWRNLRTLSIAEPVAAPKRLAAPSSLRSEALASLALLSAVDWAATMRATWTPGEAGAGARADRFLATGIESYAESRDRPSGDGTSRLSPHLRFGEIGARRLWHRVRGAMEERGDPRFTASAEAWLRQLAWREFAWHLLVHFPHTAEAPLRPEFERFAWERDAVALRAWQRGRTGFPIVDAGMRELWATGWMHNRVRMIVASFLVKDLRISWLEGARWFWDTLVDADLADNSFGWQWTAGCGADAAPYFRVFNPALQAKKFDADGAYVRRWVPELAALDDRWIHEPHKAPPLALEGAGVRLGETYPRPIVSHESAKRAALASFAALRKG